MYQHRQYGYVTLCAVLISLPIPLWILLTLPPGPSVVFGRVICGIVVAVTGVAVVLFSSLTIRIDARQLNWYFGPGFPRKSVPLADIAVVEATRTRFLEGWGIHLTRRGWLYNVSGFDAVWVKLKNDRSFLLGTDEPERLLQALRRAM